MSFWNCRIPILAAALLVSACGDNDEPEYVPPVPPPLHVSITATPTVGTEPLMVQFFADVSGGTGEVTYAWDFGDGSTRELANPSHVFGAGGSPYTVTLTVTDEAGASRESVVEIAVDANDQPTPMASATPTSGAAPLTVDFDCLVMGGNGPIDVAWSFGDGNGDGGGMTSYTYTVPGTYRAHCRATDADGDSGATAVDIVVGTDSMPKAMISASQAHGQAPLPVELTGAAIGGDGDITYSWTMSDGTTGTGELMAHTFTTPGLHMVALTVTDADGDSDTATLAVTVDPPNVPPVAVASATGSDCAVTGISLVQLDARMSSDPEGAALRYQWHFVTLPPGSTAAFNNSHIANPTFVPDVSGTYELRVFVSDGVSETASNLLTVTSSGPANLVELSGNNQIGGAGTELAEPLAVMVTNACGAPTPGAAVQWTGTNAELAETISFTDSNGRASTVVTLGATLGSGSATATLLGVGGSVDFTFTVNSGPVARIMMDATDPVPISATTPYQLTFRATDQYGNLVTDAVSFDVGMAPGATRSATFDSDGDGDCRTGTVPALTGVTVTDGIATAYICSTTVGAAYIAIQNVVSPGVQEVQTGGQTTWLSDDFERDTGNYDSIGNINLWERGTPTYPSGLSGYSPTNVRGTVLGGPIDTQSGLADFSALRTIVDTGQSGAVYSAYIDFNHFYSTTISPNVGCEANAQLWETCVGCELLEPEGGYNGQDCGAISGAPAFVGTNGNFTPVRFDISDVAGGRLELFWSLTFYENSGDAGWYIDDLRIWGEVEYPAVRFTAGPATQVSIRADNTGVVQACSPVTIGGALVDELGNVVNENAQITLTADNNGEFADVLLGSDLTPGSTATLTTENGYFAVTLVDTAATAEEVTVTAQITGLPVGPNGTVVASFADVAPNEAGAAGPGGCSDGVDNDCDGAVDCADSECAALPECVAEVCLNAVDDGINGLTDCEDPTCHGTFECQTQLGGSCNGIDDEDFLGFPGAVDEFSCNCLSNDGCDDIEPGIIGAPYLCHEALAPIAPAGMPVCAPDCRIVDWCPAFGLSCDFNTGFCVQ